MKDGLREGAVSSRDATHLNRKLLFVFCFTKEICWKIYLHSVLLFSHGFLNRVPRKVWFFWSQTKKKSIGQGGRGGGKKEKRAWQSNLSCFPAVIYENKILSFCCNLLSSVFRIRFILIRIQIRILRSGSDDYGSGSEVILILWILFSLLDAMFFSYKLYSSYNPKM